MRVSDSAAPARRSGSDPRSRAPGAHPIGLGLGVVALAFGLGGMACSYSPTYEGTRCAPTQPPSCPSGYTCDGAGVCHGSVLPIARLDGAVPGDGAGMPSSTRDGAGGPDVPADGAMSDRPRDLGTPPPSGMTGGGAGGNGVAPASGGTSGGGTGRDAGASTGGTGTPGGGDAGARGTGGRASSGGTLGTAGSSGATGGRGTGGVAGPIGSGGTAQSGGRGVVPGTGGAPGTGGRGTGGAPQASSGGATASGGAPGTGGIRATGGAPAATGGVTGTGGAPSTGGAPGTGGTPACMLGTATNCGSCGLACNGQHASMACSNALRTGVCVVSACVGPPWRDCNGVAGDGCEQNIQNDVAHCGSCDVACDGKNATWACTSGTCAIRSCDPGFDDCNGVASDGCEANLATDSANCGRCGSDCSFLGLMLRCTRGECSLL